MEDFQWLLPFSAEGHYRRPRKRHPPEIPMEEYFVVIDHRPAQWIKLPNQKSGDSPNRRRQLNSKQTHSVPNICVEDTVFGEQVARGASNAQPPASFENVQAVAPAARAARELRPA